MAGDLVDRAWIQGVVDALVAANDPERARGQQAYMKSAMPYHGVTTAVLRRMMRPAFADAAARWDRVVLEQTVRQLWDEATHREQRYVAIGVTGHRGMRAWQDSAMMPLYAHMITTGAWWDYVDEIAIRRVGPIVRGIRGDESARMLAWAQCDDMWLRRTAILHQHSYKLDTDTAILATIIQGNLQGSRFGGEFFVRKAIGWALREYAYTDAAWVRHFVDAHAGQLSGLSRREALKHLGPG